MIGSGFMGLTYSEVVARHAQGCRLAAIAGGRRAEQLAAEYGVPGEATIDALVARDDVQAVVLATPDQERLELTRKAAAAGKHVLAEKPMAPTVAECDAMIVACRQARVQGRFLWLRWARGKRLGEWRAPGGEARLLSAEHVGYRSLGVVHRRSVVHLSPDGWWIVDDLLGEGEHEACLTWRLTDGPGEVQADGCRSDDEHRCSRAAPGRSGGPVGSVPRRAATRGDSPDEPTRGWVSPTYSVLDPAVELAIYTRGKLPLRLITRFDLGEPRPGEARIEWREPGAMPPVRSISRGRFRWEL